MWYWRKELEGPPLSNYLEVRGEGTCLICQWESFTAEHFHYHLLDENFEADPTAVFA